MERKLIDMERVRCGKNQNLKLDSLTEDVSAFDNFTVVNAVAIHRCFHI